MPLLKFNTKIYKKEAVREAVSAYSSLAKIKIEETKDYIEIRIDHIDCKFKGLLADEFSNYALGMAKKCF